MQATGIIALFAAILVSRIVNERAYQKLAPDEKLRLMDGFSRTRAYSLVPLLIMIAVFWLLMTQTTLEKQVISVGYFGVLAAYVIVRSVLNRQKLIQLKLPAEYRRAFAIAQIVSLVGLAWFFFATFFV
jgi:hypothetical protein